MADTVSVQKRSEMMSAIKGKNTKPELLVRSMLHAEGFRFRLHKQGLPGRPDIVLPRFRAIIFVNGCYWHGHAECRKFRLPKSNVEFWRAKITATKSRDLHNYLSLQQLGWRIMVVWECSLENSTSVETLMHDVREFLRSDQTFAEIKGFA